MNVEGGEPRDANGAAAAVILKEGIYLILSRWTALLIAVENESAGRGTRQLADRFASDIYSWFTKPRKANEPLYIDDLEEILDNTMLHSLNIVMQDDGVEIEEVAEKLMSMHQECMEGSYSSVEKLRKAAAAGPSGTATRQYGVRQDAIDDDDDASSESDEGDDDMMMVDSPAVVSRVADGDDDGWTVVSSHRNRGRRNR